MALLLPKEIVERKPTETSPSPRRHNITTFRFKWLFHRALNCFLCLCWLNWVKDPRNHIYLTCIYSAKLLWSSFKDDRLQCDNSEYTLRKGLLFLVWAWINLWILSARIGRVIQPTTKMDYLTMDNLYLITLVKPRIGCVTHANSVNIHKHYLVLAFSERLDYTTIYRFPINLLGNHHQYSAHRFIWTPCLFSQVSMFNRREYITYKIIIFSSLNYKLRVDEIST